MSIFPSTKTIALVQETDAMCLASYCFVNCLEFGCDDLCSVSLMSHQIATEMNPTAHGPSAVYRSKLCSTQTVVLSQFLT